MEDRIKELVSRTQGMVSNIEAASYEQLAEFVEWRGKVISSIIESDQQGQIALKNYHSTIEEIMSYDTQLLDRMNHFKLEASDELIKLQTSKKQRSGYDAAYSVDSVFYDEKK